MPQTYYRAPNRWMYAQPTHRPLSYQPSPGRGRSLFIMLATLLGACFLACALGGGLLAWFVISHISSHTPLEEVPLPSGDYSVQGKPSITVNFINRVLERYDSPAAGKGQALYDYGQQYGIDPVYALAFFLHESRLGTQGVATVTHSLGNIRTTKGYEDYKGYRMYKTWEEGFEDWYKLIAKLYVGKWKLYTVEQIIPVYAPARDNNNEKVYISTVKTAVDSWRAGIVKV